MISSICSALLFAMLTFAVILGWKELPKPKSLTPEEERIVYIKTNCHLFGVNDGFIKENNKEIVALSPKQIGLE